MAKRGLKTKSLEGALDRNVQASPVAVRVDPVQVIHGDSREALKLMADASVDSVVCDPPYALVSITKRFANSPRSERTENTENPYGRTGRGFMGQRWDTGETAFDPAFWEEVLRVLKPGAHLIAFGGTRTYHRLVCAIEDAGFEIRDQLAWLFGSGFPKSHNQPGGWGTALKPAHEPIVLARKPLIGTVAANMQAHGTGALNIDASRVENGEARPAFEYFETGSKRGYDGGIKGGKVVGKKTEGRWPANVIHDGSEEVLRHFPESDGCQPHAINSVNAKYEGWGSITNKNGETVGYEGKGSAARFFYAAKPDMVCELCDADIANESLRASEGESSALIGALGSLSPDDAANHQASSANAGNAESHSAPCRQRTSDFAQSAAPTLPLSRIVQNVRSAARLCDSCATAIAQKLAEARRTGCADRSPITCSIADFKKTILSRSLASHVAHRESTDTILTTESLRELFGSVFHAIAEHTNSERSGATTRSEQSRLWYSSKADAEDRLGSKHPTVKPVDLMAYLVRLVTPPGGLVLDPFAGSGTTGMACMREGFRAVLIEREAEYVADIKRRIAHVKGEDAPLFAEAAP